MSLIIPRNFKRAKAQDAAVPKFRIGQEVVVKTKYTEPYRARIVGLWDMSKNGPYDEQGYLIKNIKGGGVESMPEHALSLATAKDSAAQDAANWTANEKRTLASGYHPNGGRQKIGSHTAEFTAPLLGSFFVSKEADNQIKVYFTPADPYAQGWMKMVSTAEDVNRIMGTWKNANSRAGDAAACDAQFKIGDKVKRGNQIGVVKGIEKEPYIEVKFRDEPITLFVHERELKIFNSRAGDSISDKEREEFPDREAAMKYVRGTGKTFIVNDACDAIVL